MKAEDFARYEKLSIQWLGAMMAGGKEGAQGEANRLLVALACGRLKAPHKGSPTFRTLIPGGPLLEYFDEYCAGKWDDSIAYQWAEASIRGPANTFDAPKERDMHVRGGTVSLTGAQLKGRR